MNWGDGHQLMPLFLAEKSGMTDPQKESGSHQAQPRMKNHPAWEDFVWSSCINPGMPPVLDSARIFLWSRAWWPPFSHHVKLYIYRVCETSNFETTNEIHCWHPFMLVKSSFWRVTNYKMRSNDHDSKTPRIFSSMIRILQPESHSKHVINQPHFYHKKE